MALAGAQHGLVAARQLRALRLDSRAIRRRVERKWLIDRGGGLFQVGPIAGPLAREAAALLRYGDRSTVSDGTAAASWELRERRPSAPVHLTLPTGAAKRPGVRLHRRKLAPHDRVIRHGLRLTTPARTIADLSPSLPAVELQRLIEEAQRRRLATREELEHCGPGRPLCAARSQLTMSPASRAPRPSAACSSSSAPPICRHPVRTSASTATRSTSSGRLTA